MFDFSLSSALLLLGVLVILASGSLVWLQYHDKFLESYMIVRQCYTREALDLFLLPDIF